ncbi:hypothetical protein N2152v2_001736 [Parachlorella kessleri]
MVLAMLGRALRTSGGVLSRRSLVTEHHVVLPRVVGNPAKPSREGDARRSRALSCAAASWLGSPQQQQQDRRRRQRELQRCRYVTEAASEASSSSSSSSSNNAVLTNTTSFLRNLDNGAEGALAGTVHVSRRSAKGLAVIFLVGTAHVSRRSAEEVRDMIRLVKPDAVMVELCADRASRLRNGQSATEMDFFKEMLSLVMPGGRRGSGGGLGGANFGQQLFKLTMQGFYRFLKSLGMDPGGEFKAAMEEADKLGARVVYGDRGMQETLQRLGSALSFQDVLRMVTGAGMKPPSQPLVDFFNGTAGGGIESQADFFNGTAGGGIESQVEAMKTRAMAREMSNYMRQVNPQLAAALIDERDQFMVNNLRKLKGRVVAVVGLAHLDGIEKRWEETQHGAATSAIGN